MDESVFGAGFDLQDYIHKRSLDIQDLRERALYRQVTDTLMVNLFQYLGDEQKKLEQRILSEIQSRESEFTIHIGVTEPDLYDASDRFLTPICPEDVEHVRPTLSDCLDQNEPVPVDRVFLRQNAQEALKFEREGAVYQGTLTTQAGAFPATVFHPQEPAVSEAGRTFVSGISRQPYPLVYGMLRLSLQDV